MANIVYIATSVDGYIATKDGGIDWLHELPNPSGDDFGFADFMDRVDALVMGKNTYEKVLSFDGEWPYSKKVFVLSNSLSAPDPRVKDKVEIVSGELKSIVKKLNSEGYKNLYIDGGTVIQSFLKEDLIDELIISRIPIVLGSGIPLFSNDGPTLKLEHVETNAYDIGIVKSRYRRR